GEQRRPEGTTPCKANCPCTGAPDAELGPGAGARVSPQRCRTAVAGCTADLHRARRRVTRMRSNTVGTQPRALLAAKRSLICCERCVTWPGALRIDARAVFLPRGVDLALGW